MGGTIKLVPPIVVYRKLLFENSHHVLYQNILNGNINMICDSNDQQQFTRICNDCEKIINYKTLASKRVAEWRSAKCADCGNKNRKRLTWNKSVDTSWTRECPKCNKTFIEIENYRSSNKWSPDIC